MTSILLAIFMFTAVVLLLVLLLMGARRKLVATGDVSIVVNEDGDHVAVAYHGKKSVANMSGYLKSTTPLIGASVTLANATAGLGGVTGTFFVDSVALNRAPNDFQQVTIGASNHGF